MEMVYHQFEKCNPFGLNLVPTLTLALRQATLLSAHHVMLFFHPFQSISFFSLFSLPRLWNPSWHTLLLPLQYLPLHTIHWIQALHQPSLHTHHYPTLSRTRLWIFIRIEHSLSSQSSMALTLESLPPRLSPLLRPESIQSNLHKLHSRSLPPFLLLS